MKKIIKHILVLVIMIIYTSSCNDYFELEQPPEPAWNTVTEFERAPIGLYATLFSGANWNNPWVNNTVVKVSMGDDVDWVSNAEWGYWRETKEHNRYTTRAFHLIYRAVAGANDALQFVEEHNGNPFPEASEDDKENNVDRIIGEIHFIRGFAYFQLQTTFGHAYEPGGNNANKDIPLRTTFPNSMDDAKNPKMGTTQEVYDLIIADFLKAKEMLPEEYIEGSMHPSYQVRANKFAAAAMLAKTYFMMGQYDKALNELNFIIEQNNGTYDLSEDPVEAFNKSDISRGNEVIFYIPFYGDNAPPPLHMTVLNHNAGNWGQCNWVETRMGESTIKRLGWMDDPDNDTTINLSAKADKRFQQLFMVRYPTELAKEGQATDKRLEVSEITTIWPNKYFRGPGNFKTNIPVIRLAELYLTRSIIRFNNGDKDGAAADLNMVMRRSWDESIGGPYQEITAAEITAQMIHDERIIEMFGENDRIDYLRGLKVDIPNGERGDGSDPYTSESFVWDLPEREKLYNESLE